MHLLTHVFLALTFASKEELGWDPTIEPIIREDGERAYRIEVDGEIYETVRVISESSANALVSRASRTWIVIHVQTKRTYFLKDIWVEDTRKFEHQILHEILRDVEGKYGSDVRKEVANHLVTPVQHWVVQVDGRPDHTTQVMMRSYEPQFHRYLPLKIKAATVSSRRNGVGPAAASDVKSPKGASQAVHKLQTRTPVPRQSRRTVLHGKWHYRIVFEEGGLTLDTVQNLSDVFKVLGDDAKGKRRTSIWVYLF